MGEQYISEVFFGEVSNGAAIECQQNIDQAFMPAGIYRVVDGQLFRITDELPEQLLKNTVDLDPMISKLIDDHFWELF